MYRKPRKFYFKKTTFCVLPSGPAGKLGQVTTSLHTPDYSAIKQAEE